jgi:hypothetical protein
VREKRNGIQGRHFSQCELQLAILILYDLKQQGRQRAEGRGQRAPSRQQDL